MSTEKDEQHCSCAPHLRKRLAELEAENQFLSRARDEAEALVAAVTEWRPRATAPIARTRVLILFKNGSIDLFWCGDGVRLPTAVIGWLPRPNPRSRRDE